MDQFPAVRRREWAMWWRRSVNRKILAATLTTGLLTAAVKLAGGLKIVAIASYFGTSDALEAFLIAFLIPTFLADLIGSSLAASLIPGYFHLLQQKGEDAAHLLLRNAAGWSLLLLGGLSALLAAAAAWVLPLVAWNFSPEKLALARTLFWVLLPVLALSGLSVVWRAVLNATGRFALAAAAPAATPLLTIALLLAAGDRYGVSLLAAGALGGVVMELALVMVAMHQAGCSVIPGRPFRDAGMAGVLEQFQPMLGGSLVLMGALFIDQAMAAMLDPGSVAAFLYGSKLSTVIIAIGPAALSTAVLPHYSKLVAAGDFSTVRNTLRTYSRAVLLGAVPITLLLVALSGPIVRLLLERGAFTKADTELVVGVQSYFLLQVPFAMLTVLVVRLISSLRCNQGLLRAAVLALGVNVLLNWLLMRPMGVAGIALATSLTAAITLLYLVLELKRALEKREAGMKRGDEAGWGSR